ncbi:MAG: tripartite tricarboxylate transporter substrate binding protein [Burkholderiaceae bacterium]|jgi:tripartite-type tricarboxylate transporter receptor subunit TctC
MNTVTRRHLILATAAATLAAPSSAQTFPSRPVRLVVPYPPGGPLDLAARALAEAMREPLGGTVIVENRSGAGGNLGADHVAKSPADGYSLLIGAVATHAINPSLYPRMPYDAERDFAPISLIAVVPNVLVLNEAFAQRESIRTVDDFVAVLRRRPGAFQFASGGNGSAGHLAGELFKQQTQTFAVHIPYRGAGPAQLALMSGEVQFMFDNLASAAPRIREGRILPLGLTTVSRTPAMPELAPLSELSPRELKGFDISTWYGLFAPAGTPRAIIDRLRGALLEAMKSERFMQTMRTQAAAASPTTPEAFAQLIRTEAAKYKELVARSGATID